jgi:hypothetical protein
MILTKVPMSNTYPQVSASNRKARIGLGWGLLAQGKNYKEEPEYTFQERSKKKHKAEPKYTWGPFRERNEKKHKKEAEYTWRERSKKKHKAEPEYTADHYVFMLTF